MRTTIKYMGPSVHDRIISRDDLERADVDIPKKDEAFEGLRWEAHSARRRVVLESDEKETDNPVSVTLQKAIVDLLSQDPTFEISVDDEVVAEASPDAGKTNADGSNAASGAGGSASLAATGAAGASSSAGTRAGTAGTTGGGVGGSTASR